MDSDYNGRLLPVWLLSSQAFNISCQGHHIKCKPQKAIFCSGEGAKAFWFQMKPEPVLKYPLSQLGFGQQWSSGCWVCSENLEMEIFTYCCWSHLLFWIADGEGCKADRLLWKRTDQACTAPRDGTKELNVDRSNLSKTPKARACWLSLTTPTQVCGHKWGPRRVPVYWPISKRDKT